MVKSNTITITVAAGAPTPQISISATPSTIPSTGGTFTVSGQASGFPNILNEVIYIVFQDNFGNTSTLQAYPDPSGNFSAAFQVNGWISGKTVNRVWTVYATNGGGGNPPNVTSNSLTLTQTHP